MEEQKKVKLSMKKIKRHPMKLFQNQVSLVIQVNLPSKAYQTTEQKKLKATNKILIKLLKTI